jgi:hypothetical protein
LKEPESCSTPVTPTGSAPEDFGGPGEPGASEDFGGSGEPGALVYAAGFLLAAAVSAAVAGWWLGLMPAVFAALVGGLAGLAGVFMLDNIVEAVVLTVLVAVLMVAAASMNLPLPTLFKGLAVSGVLGFCSGKLVCGVWRETGG